MRVAVRLPSTVAVVLLTAALSGCGRFGPWLGAEAGLDQERTQADAALLRWEAAVEAAGGMRPFVPVGELTGQVGNWEPDVGDNNKTALMSGTIAASADLPARAGAQEIRWDNGATLQVGTISADEALVELRASAEMGCPECVPLNVTGARLSTATFQTSRGPATVPAWEFTLEGTDVLVTRSAVAANGGIAVQPPPWDPNSAPVGISVESATGTVGGHELVVEFIGAPERSNVPCGADYTAEAVESETAVVVIVKEHPDAFDGACNLAGATRMATVTLSAPLGDRAVLEVKEGLPVPVVLAP